MGGVYVDLKLYLSHKITKKKLIYNCQININLKRMRKLASIQIVSKIIKHDNADLLEIASVLGWEVITSLNEVKEGDKIVYCEIDSLLPVDKEWLPISIKNEIQKKNPKKFRIKTKKIRGKFSQGLIIPITESISSLNEFEIGTDVSDLLEIEKYDNDLDKKKGDFPVHLIDKTNESRIQSNPEFLEVFNSKPYYCTLKLDGTSATYLYENDNFLICSRNRIVKKKKSYWFEIANKYNLKEKLMDHKNIGIQGEICGPGIQRNLLKLKELDFFIFNVVDLSTKKRYPLSDMISFCEKIGLKHVPVEEISENFNYSLKELIEKSKGFYENTKNFREGLVFRNETLSFKIINNDYLDTYNK